MRPFIGYSKACIDARLFHDTSRFSKTFDSFPAKEGLAITKKIQERMIDQLFTELDVDMPNVEISTEEIQEEINAYRKEKSFHQLLLRLCFEDQL